MNTPHAVTAHIACSVGTPSEHYPADEQTRNGALDYDVTVTIGAVVTEGSVTLYRDQDGAMGTCGTPLDGWCSSEIVHLVRGLSDRSCPRLLGEIAALCAAGQDGEIALAELTAEQHGADDAQTTVDDALINAGPGDDDPVETARGMLQSVQIEPDEALISALGWAGVYKIAWLAYKEEVDHPSPEALAWCARYNTGYRARLAEIVADEDLGSAQVVSAAGRAEARA